MRILLAANASYVPPRGGATRSNLLWLDHLAAAGHECRVVSSALIHDAAGKARQIREEEIAAHWTHTPVDDGLEIYSKPLLTVFSAAGHARQLHVLRDEIRAFQPDWVLVSSEDLGHVLLREAWQAAPGRLVYLAHTPQFFPFGPASWNPDAEAARIVARAAAVVAIGHHTAGYIREHTGRGVVVVHPPIYGSGPFPMLARFDRGLITMVNPCAVKGISIFLELARRLPEYEFGALPGWGTTREDREAMARLENIRLLPNRRNIDDVLSLTRVLLMPSLWYEGFGLSVMEAMLRGIPVVSSDAGGLVEAKKGTGFIVPVRAIERYTSVFDEHGLPAPVVEPSPIEPWEEAAVRLLTDRAVYEEESERSRAAALEFVAGLRAAQLEELLLGLAPAADAAPPPADPLKGLSPEKRALLLKKLRSRPAASGQH